MKKLALLIPEGKSSPLAITGVSTICKLGQQYGLAIDYKILSTQKEAHLDAGKFILKSDERIEQGAFYDFLIIPSIIGPVDDSLRLNKDLCAFVKNSYEKGSKIISMCTGAYLLAETGLLDGYEASSHYAAIDDLKNRFPQVHWKADKIITDQDGLYTSGGTLSSFNVLIYLMEKYFDKEIAYSIAKVIQMDYPRNSQKPFYIFSNQKNHEDELILNIQNHLEKTLDQQISLHQICHRFGISRRSLNRRFKQATGENPQIYIQRIKVEQAKRWLESSGKHINEITTNLGYQDLESFRKVFKKISGLLPSEYRRKLKSSS
ncbi:MAG: helix-turn-helix domain-containing protein [Bacteroidia bacterium]|nr:helix-turn-helix domain-containing protein [Bacteroidia bacterium]